MDNDNNNNNNDKYWNMNDAFGILNFQFSTQRPKNFKEFWQHDWLCFDIPLTTPKFLDAPRRLLLPYIKTHRSSTTTFPKICLPIGKKLDTIG